MIHILGAKKTYTNEVKIGPLTLQIPKAGITSLIGPNGAGKSTIMKIICGYISATSGTVSVNGFDVERQSMEVRRNIG